MNPLKIITVIGARPQFIKASIVSRKLNESPLINEVLVHTGQHFNYNMDKIFFEELKIPTPSYNLNINSLSHGAMTGKMIQEIESILLTEKPDFVMVYGDTNSTLAGALAAKKLLIPLIHVEAGLRSFNMNMPEEINRILTDRISDILFCPTKNSIENLHNEGFENFPSIIINSGDVMYDLALHFQQSVIFPKSNPPNDYILCTIHREENTSDIAKLKSIIKGLNKIAGESTVILPLHPRTKKIIYENNLKINFQLSDPLGYYEMMELLRHCRLVITDSGGLQKESYFYCKFCITLREETEWSELVQSGYNILAGHDDEQIYRAYQIFTDTKKSFNELFYGNGHACEVILNTILNHPSQHSK